MKRAKVPSSKNLADLWISAIRQLRGAELIRSLGIAKAIPADSALLFWGKAAQSCAGFFEASGRWKKGPRLFISPETSGHPLPDARSFEMGARILRFFDFIGRSGTHDLAIFLSGGSSSLAWLKPSGLTERQIRSKLKKLYRLPITIRELNRRRARLCLLKSGGATRWLRLLAPQVRAQVYVISDVAPFGTEVVGSGPFIGLPLRELADNSALVKTVTLRAGPERILKAEHSVLATEDQWAREIAAYARRALARKQQGLFIRGGEPAVRLPHDPMRTRSRRQGGRQCQIAARLALEFWDEIRRGDLEILCASSDGVDGTSGAAAAHLRNPARKGRIPTLSPTLRRQLEKAIASFDTAPFLSRQGFLIPSFETGTNVQDIVIVRVGAAVR